MKKNEIIKKNKDFSYILNKGKKIKNNYFSIFYYPNDNNNHYGISIPTKTGNAVTRNKLKRQIKNIIDTNKKSIQTNYDYVIIIKKNILDLKYPQIEKYFLSLMTKIGEKDEEK